MYSPAKQSAVDKGRLRYDEWIAQCDAAFGQFVAGLQSSGRFDDLALIVSSDHGESFTGGFVGHGGAQQLRPIVHVPLIVHLPGQTQRYDIGTVADQTALSPTLLDIAGLAAPDWMEGRALSFAVDPTAARGEAFTQYLSPNHAFGAIRHGTVGVIDGQQQYIFDLERRTGSLFDLAEAHEQRADLAQAQPQIAAALQADIRARFPNLMGAA
jgi:arylsulfatase A-like enzyme